MRANERVAQYLRLYSCLFQTTVHPHLASLSVKYVRDSSPASSAFGHQSSIAPASPLSTDSQGDLASASTFPSASSSASTSSSSSTSASFSASSSAAASFSASEGRRAYLSKTQSLDSSMKKLAKTGSQPSPKPLWSGTTKNQDVSTGPLARLFARSLAPDCSLRSRAPLRSLFRSLTRSLAHSLCSLPRSWDSE